MTFDDMQKAVSDAKHTMRVADNAAAQLASILVGRLRNVDSGWVLSALKDELRSYNAHTKTWK